MKKFLWMSFAILAILSLLLYGLATNLSEMGALQPNSLYKPGYDFLGQFTKGGLLAYSSVFFTVLSLVFVTSFFNSKEEGQEKKAQEKKAPAQAQAKGNQEVDLKAMTPQELLEYMQKGSAGAAQQVQNKQKELEGAVNRLEYSLTLQKGLEALIGEKDTQQRRSNMRKLAIIGIIFGSIIMIGFFSFLFSQKSSSTQQPNAPQTQQETRPQVTLPAKDKVKPIIGLYLSEAIDYEEAATRYGELYNGQKNEKAEITKYTRRVLRYYLEEGFDKCKAANEYNMFVSQEANYEQAFFLDYFVQVLHEMKDVEELNCRIKKIK